MSEIINWNSHCGSRFIANSGKSINRKRHFDLFLFIQNDFLQHIAYLQHVSYHSHKKRIVCKHGPNRSFYALMLRTKLCWNPFFFTGDQNVNKPKIRAARTVYEPIFLAFYKIIVSIFSFFLSRCKQSKIEL